MSQVKQQKKVNMTEGSIWKQILLFFFPILLGALFQQLYNTVDAFVVGNFAGKEALGSVGGSASQITGFVFQFFMGLSAGATVIIAQYFGAKNSKKTDEALHTAYTFGLVGGVILGIFGILIARIWLKAMKTPDTLLDASTNYIRILFAGLVFALIYNIGSGILRAVGDSKRPLYVLIMCCGVNIVLDLLFVIVFKMGAEGAGIATLIAQIVSSIIISWLLVKKTPGMKLSFAKLGIKKEMLFKILQIGLPTAVATSMFSVANMIIQTSINSMGINEVAAWTAYSKIDAVWWMTNGAFSTSVSTFVGQNFGAGLGKRIRRGTYTVLGMEVAVAILYSLMMVNFNQPLLGLFVSDPEVLVIGKKIAFVLAPYIALFCFSEIFASTLRAEGHVFITTAANIIGVCFFRIAWIKFIYPHGNIKQVMMCYPISWVLIAAVVMIYYFKNQNKILQAHCSDMGSPR